MTKQKRGRYQLPLSTIDTNIVTKNIQILLINRYMAVLFIYNLFQFSIFLYNILGIYKSHFQIKINSVVTKLWSVIKILQIDIFQINLQKINRLYWGIFFNKFENQKYIINMFFIMICVLPFQVIKEILLSIINMENCIYCKMFVGYMTKI